MTLEQTTNKTIIGKALSWYSCNRHRLHGSGSTNCRWPRNSNNVLADQAALLADNQPVDHNRGNQPAVDAVVSARLLFIRFVPIFYGLQAIHQRL